jgi:hypothetical protein
MWELVCGFLRQSMRNSWLELHDTAFYILFQSVLFSYVQFYLAIIYVAAVLPARIVFVRSPLKTDVDDSSQTTGFYPNAITENFREQLLETSTLTLQFHSSFLDVSCFLLMSVFTVRFYLLQWCQSDVSGMHLVLLSVFTCSMAEENLSILPLPPFCFVPFMEPYCHFGGCGVFCYPS